VRMDALRDPGLLPRAACRRPDVGVPERLTFQRAEQRVASGQPKRAAAHRGRGPGAVLTRLNGRRCLVSGETPQGLWRQVVQMLEEGDKLPEIILLQHVHEGGHCREADAVANDDEDLSVGAGEVLPRCRTEELRRRRVERSREDVLLGVGCSVAPSAVVSVEKRGLREVLRCGRHGILPFGCRAVDGGVASEVRKPGFKRAGLRIRAHWHEAQAEEHQQADGACEQCGENTEPESSHDLLTFFLTVRDAPSGRRASQRGPVRPERADADLGGGTDAVLVEGLVPPYLPATVAPVHLDPSGRISMLQVPVHQHLQERAERAGSLAPEMARGERLAPLPAGQGFEKGTVVEERAPLVVVTPLRRSKADDSALLFGEASAGWLDRRVRNALRRTSTPHRSSRCGATTSRVCALGTTGTISIVAPEPLHWSTHSWNRRKSSHSMSWKHRLKFGSTQLSMYLSPSGIIRPVSRSFL